jgi:signal transduction histidine kinase
MRKTRLETTGVKPIPTHLAELVEQISASLSEGHDDLVLALDPNTPRALTDPEGVRSILENLVDNARKYAKSTAESPIEVRVRTTDSRPTLEVSDRGPGVPAADRERIFDAFYRSGDEDRRSAKGIGLGLHLAALHANAMGARIQISDRPGGGAVFTVRFQAAAAS